MIERRYMSQCGSVEYCRGWNEAVGEMENADVVEVVRCKNCKHYKKDENGWCWLFGMYVDDNHLKDENYCSYAEEVGK